MFPRRKVNDQVSVTFLSSHFRSSFFPFFYFFLTHVQDRMINVSEILPLRPIKVNNGKFYLLLRSGYFVNGCVFTRVYVICKICEKLRRIRSCRYLLYLSQWDTVQERMGPSKERSAGQRTYLSLMLTEDVLFGVHFENNCKGCCKCARFLRLLELGVCLVLLPDSTTRHLRVVIYYCRSVSLQWSIASLVKRPFYFWDKDTVEQKPRDAQV